MFSTKYILFHIQKIKIKNFIVVVTLLNFTYSFRFLFFLLYNVFLYLLLWEEFFLFFRWLASSSFRHFRQFQVIVMIFSIKALVNISSISNSKNPAWNLLSLVPRIVVNECLRNSVRNCFSFVLTSNYWWNYKNIWFSQ